jgi:purine nucleosidase
MTPILLDLDLAMGAPGSDIDDGFALALAVADPEIDLRLVTTVSGNTDAETATTLTLELLDRLGVGSVPVHQGATRALQHPATRFGRLPEGVGPRSPQPGHGVLALIEKVLAEPGQLTLVAVGPLTNVALAMLLEPAFAESLADLVIMGGVFAETTGRTDLPGEFNVWSDPHAAHIVLQSGVVATWVGLDVTRRVRLTRADAAAMAADAHPFTAFAGQYSAAWIDHLAETEDPGTDSCALHDPLAVAAISRPDLLRLAEAHLTVQRDGVARGVMVADQRINAARPANARIAVDVDPAGFAAHLTGCLRRLG